MDQLHEAVVLRLREGEVAVRPEEVLQLHQLVMGERGQRRVARCQRPGPYRLADAVLVGQEERLAAQLEPCQGLDIDGRPPEEGRLPVVNFAAGGVATPADAALMMQLGAEGVFVGSGIFKSGDPATRANAIVQAVTHYNDPKIIAEVSKDLGEAMVGISARSIPENELLASRSK